MSRPAPDDALKVYVGYREDPAVLAAIDALAGGRRGRSAVIRRATAELVAREARKRERMQG